MITVSLAKSELAFLFEQLERRTADLEHELIHTDRRQMQRELARDVARLRAILWRLARAQEESAGAPAGEAAPAGLGHPS